MHNDPIKTAKTSLQLVSVTRDQITGGVNFQLGHRFSRSSCHVANITAHLGGLSRFSASTFLLIIPRPFGSGYARLGISSFGPELAPTQSSEEPPHLASTNSAFRSLFGTATM